MSTDIDGPRCSRIYQVNGHSNLAQGLFDFGKAYLNTLCALVPFLERELIDTLPYMCCSLLPVFPPSLSQG